MHLLDELILVVNRELDVDICVYSRQYPYPWAKAIYAHLAIQNTNSTHAQIMERIGLERTSIFSKIKTVEDLYGLEKRFTRMYDKVADVVKSGNLNNLEEKKPRTIVEVQLEKIKLLISELDTKEFYSKGARAWKKKQLLKIIDTLAAIETQRKQTDL